MLIIVTIRSVAEDKLAHAKGLWQQNSQELSRVDEGNFSICFPIVHECHQSHTFLSQDVISHVCAVRRETEERKKRPAHSCGGPRRAIRDKKLSRSPLFFSNQGRKQELMSQGHKQDAVIFNTMQRGGDPGGQRAKS